MSTSTLTRTGTLVMLAGHRGRTPARPPAREQPPASGGDGARRCAERGGIAPDRDTCRRRRFGLDDLSAAPYIDGHDHREPHEGSMSIRHVKRIVESKPTMEGAGVKLRRAFGFGDTGEFDPFLLPDDFRNDRPDDYRAGFPWHPHRGIETITYVLRGTVDHGDSLGNRGTLGAGDVQWMTAGRGVLHQEMPQGDPQGQMHGFQLWANLPSSLNMSAPRYQDIPAIELPEVTDDDGTRVRVVCGDFWGKRGPVDG